MINDANYEQMLKRIEHIKDAVPGTQEYNELFSLTLMVNDYESRILEISSGNVFKDMEMENPEELE